MRAAAHREAAGPIETIDFTAIHWEGSLTDPEDDDDFD
jgi:hypothetical protein